MQIRFDFTHITSFDRVLSVDLCLSPASLTFFRASTPFVHAGRVDLCFVLLFFFLIGRPLSSSPSSYSSESEAMRRIRGGGDKGIFLDSDMASATPLGGQHVFFNY